MTPVFSMDQLRVDLPVPSGGLQALLPGGTARLNILSDIALHIGTGETVGLVGESGSGKTTLARTMLGLTPATAGTMEFCGVTLTGPHSFAALRRDTAMMFQDPVASLSPRMTVGALVTEPFIIHKVSLNSRRDKAIELLGQVGLPGAIASCYPHELSGGQARRVCVARALALHPKLVIADEPTAGLDVSVQGEVLNLMGDLQDQMGLSLLIISHNLAMVRHVTDRIAILYLGRLVECGPTEAVFANPQHPYTASLIASEPQPDPRKRRADLAIKGDIPSLLHRPGGCPFHTRCRVAIDRCRTQQPALRQIGPDWTASCHLTEAALAPALHTDEALI
jgi:oligopeptide/dipeptide ABC transporter ATP-binding protein